MSLFEENCLETLNFSEEWHAMYFKFPWTIEKAYRQESHRNYSIGSNNNLRNDITPKPHPLFANLIFHPNTHSTPNKKVLVNMTDPEANNSSVESMSFSTTLPHNSMKDNNTNISIPDYNNSSTPTISQKVDIECRNKFSSGESIPDVSQNKLKRKGIIKNVVSFNLDDDSTKKDTHKIQSFSIIVIVLALILIGIILIYLSSHKHIEIIKINVPMRNDFITKKKNSYDNINGIPIEKDKIIDTNRNTNTTERIIDFKDLEMGDEAMGAKPKHFADDVNKVINMLNSFPKVVTNKSKTTETKDDDKEFVDRFCRKCKLIEEVCLLNESSGIPYCAQAKDYEDPTGCGGLCAIETEACVAVDHRRQVKVCKALTSANCPPNHWKCRNGFCINNSARCDGNIDCYDKSDEFFCACDLDNNFHCGQMTSCFSKEKLCDGVTDCWDGHDESNCGMDCLNNQFSCTRGGCVPFGRFCDGYEDCNDGSDEPQGCDGPCRAHEIKCRNGRCVPNNVRCDGRDQCGDKSDEIDCS